MSKYINVNNIYFESTWNNKKIIIAMIFLLSGYYMKDVVFTKSLATATTSLPEFIKDVNIQKILILMFPYIVSMVLFYISNVLYSEALPSIQLESVSKLVDKIMYSIKISKKEINVNDLLIHIKSFAESGMFYKVLVTNIFPTLIVVIGVIYNMILADTKSGVVVAMILIILILVTTKLEYDNIIVTHKASESMNGLYDEIHEILSNIDTIITSDTEKEEKQGIEKIKKNAYHLSSFAKNNTTNTTTQMQIGSLIIVCMINYLSYRLYIQQYIDTPILISNVMMSILFMEHYTKMLEGIKNVMADIGGFHELSKYFNTFHIDENNSLDQIDDDSFDRDEIDDDTLNNLVNNNSIPLLIKRGDIEIVNINLKKRDNYIFKNLNIKIKGNMITGIIGQIGSGKTSLMKLLAGIIHYDGNVYVDNQDLKKCNYSSIMKYIAYIPQHPILFNKSLYHNISYGTRNITRMRIVKLLKELELDQFFDSFPQGLDTLAGKNGNNLSGGQKQMIALIRSLLQNKSILLLDEPTSSLDKKNKIIFINLIKKLKNKTIVINTHDETIYYLFDQIIDLDEIKSVSGYLDQ